MRSMPCRSRSTSRRRKFNPSANPVLGIADDKPIFTTTSDGKRLIQEFPDRAGDIRQYWSRLQAAWTALQQMVSAEGARIAEAQRVTQWQSRCQLVIGWAGERRLAIVAVRDIPTELDDAQYLVTEHKLIRAQISKKNLDKEDIIRFVNKHKIELRISHGWSADTRHSDGLLFGEQTQTG